MAIVRLSPTGQRLVADDQRFAAILPEFAVEDPDTGEIGDAKTYRGALLGSGCQAEVFAVGDTQVAEKVWRGASGYNSPQDGPSETFDRHLLIRDYWEKEKPPASKIYLPEYYAAVQHQSTTGAILMERSHGTAADKIGWARTSNLPAEFLSKKLGLEPEKLHDIARELGNLIRNESEFYNSLFNVVPTPYTDPGPRNMLVDYDPAAGEIIRLTAIDL